MMDDPIPVERVPQMSADDQIKIAKAAHDRKMQTMIGVIFAVALLSLIVPLGVLLTRLAMGM